MAPLGPPAGFRLAAEVLAGTALVGHGAPSLPLARAGGLRPQIGGGPAGRRAVHSLTRPRTARPADGSRHVLVGRQVPFQVSGTTVMGLPPDGLGAGTSP